MNFGGDMKAMPASRTASISKSVKLDRRLILAATLCIAALAVLVSPRFALAEEAPQTGPEIYPEIYKDISAREMSKLLGAAGLSTTVTSGASGEPMILAKKGKMRFIVRGVECAGKAAPSTDVRCTKMQFRASFDLEAYPSATWMNEFNKSWVFGKAYVTPDGKAHVEYPMNLTNGITQGNLVSNFATWTSVLESFIDHLSEGEIAPLM
jgi:hypothetical protein